MLLVSDEFYSSIKECALNADISVFITSAFIKTKALETLFQDLPENLNIEIVSRWRKNDILMKASDLAVYDFCKKRGWKFGIDQNLHGKLYLVDDKDVFLGSANLTQKGMSIGGFGNIEFGTRFDAAQLDIRRVRAYKRREVIWLDDYLFGLIKKEIDEVLDSSESGNSRWSPELLSRLDTPVEHLWVNELLFVSPNQLLQPNLDDENIAHDFEMLNLSCDNVGADIVKAQFRQTRLYSWLRHQLKNESLNFGGLTHRLHNSLFDDPVPYRKEIKEFIVIVFQWMEFLSEDFEVTKHTRTSSVILK